MLIEMAISKYNVSDQSITDCVDFIKSNISFISDLSAHVFVEPAELAIKSIFFTCVYVN